MNPSDEIEPLMKATAPDARANDEWSANAELSFGLGACAQRALT